MEKSKNEKANKEDEKKGEKECQRLMEKNFPIQRLG